MGESFIYGEWERNLVGVMGPVPMLRWLSTLQDLACLGVVERVLLQFCISFSILAILVVKPSRSFLSWCGKLTNADLIVVSPTLSGASASNDSSQS